MHSCYNTMKPALVIASTKHIVTQRLSKHHLWPTAHNPEVVETVSSLPHWLQYCVLIRLLGCVSLAPAVECGERTREPRGSECMGYCGLAIPSNLSHQLTSTHVARLTCIGVTCLQYKDKYQRTVSVMPAVLPSTVYAQHKCVHM